ncbi:MAG TPA: SPOR domain-containing protein [Ignavibacteriales bacterium]|nr:SPOR domain-containing protein [Ignavibacteriales bacterium]
MKWSLYLLSFSVFIISCGKKDKPEDTNKGIYYVQVRTFGTKDSAEDYIRKLETKTNQPLAVKEIPQQNGKQPYIVRLGNFSSSYEAGLAAYKLLNAKAIDNYLITRDLAAIPDEFSRVVVVGNFKGATALYEYDLRTGRKKKLWGHPGEMITDCSYSSDMSGALFTTVGSFGRKSIFPYVDNVKVYRIDLSSMKIEKLQNLGSGIQIYTNNDFGKAYRIIMNVFDKAKNTFVVQNTYTYDFNGRLVSNEKKSFDLAKENYPAPPELIFDNRSPDNKNQLEVSFSAGSYTFSVTRVAISSKRNILTTRQRLNEAAWSKDGRYLIFSTVDLSPRNRSLYGRRPETSNLYLFSANEGKLLKQWAGAGYKNFLLRGDLIFFDDGFKEKSQIIVYDYRNNRIIDTVAIAGGCGIRNIPYIPDFGKE